MISSKHIISESERLSHITSWLSSGLNQPEYSRRNGLKLTSFKWWIRQHRSRLSPKKQKLEKLELVPVNLARETMGLNTQYFEGSGDNFSLLQLSSSSEERKFNFSSAQHSSGLRIFLNDRYSIDIAKDFDLDTFIRIISVLSEP